MTGLMAALDRLDDLEEFMLQLQPEELFRPHSLWRLPLLGSHDYRLPATIEERLGDLTEIARDLAASPVELVVFATDVSQDVHGRGARAYELAYSSRSTPPETMAQAVLASSAVSALVLPRQVGERIATDGAWVRNFPLGHAYRQPGVELIISFRYVPTYSRLSAAWLGRMRRRLERFPKVPPVRALIAELREAEERDERGEPAHWGDMIVRLMRVTVQQNTVLEERTARDKDEGLDGARGAARRRRRDRAPRGRAVGASASRKRWQTASRRRSSRSSATGLIPRIASRGRQARSRSRRDCAARSRGR